MKKTKNNTKTNIRIYYFENGQLNEKQLLRTLSRINENPSTPKTNMFSTNQILNIVTKKFEEAEEKIHAKSVCAKWWFRRIS